MQIFLLALATLLVAAVLLGRLAGRLGLPAIVGELLAGVLLGPSVLGHLSPWVSARLFPQVPQQTRLLDAVSQFAVLLFVGVAGTHVDLDVIRRRRQAVAKVGLIGLVTPLVLGTLLGLLVPHRMLAAGTGQARFAVFLGIALCASALPVIARTLSDIKLLDHETGQLILASGLLSDAVGWFLLSIVSATATAGFRAGQVALPLLGAAGFLLVAIVVGRPGIRWILEHAAQAEHAAPASAAAVAVILVGAAISQAIHMEGVFGAFAVGVLLGSSGRSTSARLEPLNEIAMSVLAPVFLATAGLRVDIGALMDPVVLLVALTVLAAAIVGKFSGAYTGARLSRLSHWEGVALGTGLNSRGVVEVVIASVGLQLGILTASTYTVIVLVAIFTSVMTPPLLKSAVARMEGEAAVRVVLIDERVADAAK
ncbi:cation:proton antiporter [Catenulispora sp. NF23]|uniref:Cation:proton antiporter n=2 Tax=Catenulispora pinistramenti TaxID=2705254 RepID=A0ABS5KIH6_9ACTN|nr:cation:proton antiporter [Catenulispora pinistramenti]MBS2531161.1 cation:proton antiporter [Catenulispora pinistramenti]MBS2545923.1 cation:proton antiporter [Catenulispora pinistramenti]